MNTTTTMGRTAGAALADRILAGNSAEDARNYLAGMNSAITAKLAETGEHSYAPTMGFGPELCRTCGKARH